MLGFLSLIPAGGYTRIVLTEAQTGRKIFSSVLKDGEQAVLAWKNSLFSLDVTEVFRARQGMLVLDQVTFTDPGGPAPPVVAPEDVDDLYHTGGPFTASGLNKNFSLVTFRVGEIGNPKMMIRGRVVDFTQEVGFGGGLTLTASPPTWLEVVFFASLL